ETKDKEIKVLQDELTDAKAVLGLRSTPVQMLPVWALALRDGGTKDIAALASKDAESVLKDAKADETQKAQAQAVIGLSLKTQAANGEPDKYAKAKEALEAARKVLNEGDWAKLIDAALLQTTDPSAYYAKQADDLLRWQGPEALALIDRATEAAPEG